MTSFNSTFLQACLRTPTDRIPVWYMRQAGRYMPEYRLLKEKYDILTLATTPELATQITLQPVNRLGVDAAILFSDIMVLPISLGVDVKIVDGVGPVIDQPIATLDDLNRLRQFNPDNINYVTETIKMLRHELREKVPLIGFSGAPFTLASYLIEGKPTREFTKTKHVMHTSPQLWNTLMEKLTDAVSEYLSMQIYYGAQAIQIFDSWAGYLTEEEYRQFVAPYNQEIANRIKTETIPIIIFGANTSKFLKTFSDINVDVISIDSNITLTEAREIIGAQKAIQGNLDPNLLLQDFSAVKSKVDEIIAQLGDRTGFIFNLGHGILKDTKVETVIELTEYVHSK